MPKLAKNLTTDIVERAKVGTNKDGTPPAQKDFWDGKVSGLGLRVSKTGKRAWYFRYRTRSRRQRKIRIGDYQPAPGLDLHQARIRARKLRAQVDDGIDPVEEERRAKQESKTFKDLAELYLLEHALGPAVKRSADFDVWTVKTFEGEAAKRSWAEDRRKLLVEARPWANIPARDITRQDVRDLIKKKVDAGAPVSANRLQACLHKVFAVGVEFDVVDFNPLAGMRRLGGRERSRERVLSADEIRALWSATDKMEPGWRAYFRLILLTAQRPGEVRDMQWTDLDESWSWWTVAGAVAKNGLAHRVPLSAPVRELLAELKGTQEASGRFVMRGARGNRQKSIQSRELGLEDFKPHDLRRTAGTNMASAGIPRLVLGMVLNHQEAGVTGVYDRHSYDPEKLHAMEVWTARLLGILHPEPADGLERVPLSGRRPEHQGISS